MENLNVNQEMNFDQMADVVGGDLNETQCQDLEQLENSYINIAIATYLINYDVAEYNGIAALAQDVRNARRSGGC
jgi:hypothetical protein